MQDAAYDPPRVAGYTVTVKRLDGRTLSIHAADTLDAARLHVLENALPWNMRLDEALRLVDRVLAGEMVEVNMSTVEAVARDA